MTRLKLLGRNLTRPSDRTRCRTSDVATVWLLLQLLVLRLLLQLGAALYVPPHETALAEQEYLAAMACQLAAMVLVQRRLHSCGGCDHLSTLGAPFGAIRRLLLAAAGLECNRCVFEAAHENRSLRRTVLLECK